VTTSDERLAVMQLLERSDEPLSPQAVADALDRAPGAIRKLLSRMHSDNQISSPSRGLYEAVPAEGGDVTGGDGDVTDSESHPSHNATSRVGKPNTLRAFSLQHGGMVDYSELKGNSDEQ
jgi:hypothetical protein